MPSRSGARGNIKSQAGVSEGADRAESLRQHYAASEVPDQGCGRHSDEASDVCAACQSIVLLRLLTRND